jgi:GTP-binding protein HflX
VDRRRIQARITRLEADLRQLRQRRYVQRRARQRSRQATVSLVGYTNAGKSTLLNRLTDAGVGVENRLFATLDSRTRRLALPGGEVVLCSDTVGFVRKLPHQLVEAFSSTLEVVAESDLLVHVVDASAADPEAQVRAVRDVLAEIGAERVPELIALNKVDRAPGVLPTLLDAHPGSVAISAATGAGVDALLGAVAEMLRARATVLELGVPYDRGDVLAALHREGEVLSEAYEDTLVRVRARLDGPSAARFAPWVLQT